MSDVITDRTPLLIAEMDVESMSTRELQKAVKERDQAACGHEEKEQIQAELQRTYEAIQILDIEVKRGSPRRTKQAQEK